VLLCFEVSLLMAFVPPGLDPLFDGRNDYSTVDHAGGMVLRHQSTYDVQTPFPGSITSSLIGWCFILLSLSLPRVTVCCKTKLSRHTSLFLSSPLSSYATALSPNSRRPLQYYFISGLKVGGLEGKQHEKQRGRKLASG
jgi:hypothetical protein